MEVPVRAFASNLASGGRSGATAKRPLAPPPRASGGRQSVEVPDLSSHNVEMPLSASCADTVTLEPCQRSLNVSIRQHTSAAYVSIREHLGALQAPLNFNHFTQHVIHTPAQRTPTHPTHQRTAERPRRCLLLFFFISIILGGDLSVRSKKRREHVLLLAAQHAGRPVPVGYRAEVVPHCRQLQPLHYVSIRERT